MTNNEHISQFDRAYFIGVGGIGMSALARYFKFKGWEVSGYDKTKTTLTQELEQEGISIHYEDWGPSIPEPYRDLDKTLVVYTPAIPKNFGELLHVQYAGYVVKKRAEVLGMITRDSKALGVAGTHGKTTTSTMLAHILNESSVKCNAFLGGISSNFNSNFISGDSEYTVVEADEFDRSFLQLNPFASIVTSTDADHLDIYGSNDDFIDGFKAYVKRIDATGFLVHHKNVGLTHSNAFSYGLNIDADYSGSGLSFNEGRFTFDVDTPNGLLRNVELGVPGVHNAENAIACLAMCQQLGLIEDEIRAGLKTFAGVKRRFEYQIRTDELVYIDDYAHHPTEIKALISSIRLLYPHQKVTGIFQPHLFSRTRDFFEGFAEELSGLDELILLPIYPAREEPIPGITSDALLDRVWIKNKSLKTPDETVRYFEHWDSGVVLTIGAGDIDKIVPQLKEVLSK